jgi:hypothetical protein
MTVVEVPDSLAELLTPHWLTVALSSRFPGVEVTSVAPGPVVERVSTNARFRIECAAPMPPGLPSALCVKAYFSEAGRASGTAGEPEACFYRDVAGATGVHTLLSVWADVDPKSGHGVVITGDVVAAGGQFLDALSPFSVEQVASSLAEFARLHAYAWEQPARVGTGWLTPRVGLPLAVRGPREINQNFDGPNGVGMPPEIRDTPRLIDAMRTLAAREPGPGWTLAHGDAHVGNLFLDAQGRPGLLDWQCVQHGHWSIDVGYHIASALEPAERASAERDLLAHYLDELRSHGVSAPSFDDAWTHYRGGVVYGFFLWAITLYVKPDIIAALLRRLGTAVLELDSYGAIAAQRPE